MFWSTTCGTRTERIRKQDNRPTGKSKIGRGFHPKKVR